MKKRTLKKGVVIFLLSIILLNTLLLPESKNITTYTSLLIINSLNVFILLINELNK